MDTGKKHIVYSTTKLYPERLAYEFPPYELNQYYQESFVCILK